MSEVIDFLSASGGIGIWVVAAFLHNIDKKIALHEVDIKALKKKVFGVG